jgi:TAT-translocated FGD2 family F420-dependent dehydrogenase
MSHLNYRRNPMPLSGAMFSPLQTPARRNLLKWTASLAGASGLGFGTAHAQRSPQSAGQPVSQKGTTMKPGMISYMLAHEQFPVPELVQIGQLASQAGFHALATSDHLQPWQANEAHAGQAWITLAALGARSGKSWMGTTVTCPTIRYNPAVVAEAFASLGTLFPGRVFLGVGSGEALNEQAATGDWPKWQERWDRLIEAMTVIRQLWSGNPVSFKGKFYNVEARLYDPPPTPIPLLTAANGRKSMRLAGQHGDGLITDPMTWKEHKQEWEEGARDAGKNPAAMPVLVEQYVVAGNRDEAEKAAELWRFGPNAFKSYYNDPSPQKIQQDADTQIPIQKVLQSWAVGTDPAVHVSKIRELHESGVWIVNIHSGQQDQRKVVDFYARHVLPQARQPA